MTIKTNLDNPKIAPIVTEFKLPSCGLLYERKSDPGDKTEKNQNQEPLFGPLVKISPYSFDTERILMTNLTPNEKMARIVGECANLPAEMSPMNLLLFDVLTIMAIARALTYGEEYSFKSECPECNFKESHQIKVPQELPVKTWEQFEDRIALEKTLEFTLPHGKDKIRYRYFTMQDEADLAKAASMAAATSRTSIEEERYIIRLAMHLVSVNGGAPDNLSEARAYIKRLQGPNMVAYEEEIQKNRCGVTFAWNVLCGNHTCNHQYEALIPMIGNFFRGD